MDGASTISRSPDDVCSRPLLPLAIVHLCYMMYVDEYEPEAVASVSAVREEDARRRNQEKHYQLLRELQTMASEVPVKYQQRMPYELLSDLANCLIDETVGKIVEGLKDIQHMTEKNLYEKRQRTVDQMKMKRSELIKRLRSEVQLGLLTEQQARQEEELFDRKSEEELHRFDMKVVMDLDQVVSEQQVTLERAGVSGFRVTNNATEIRLQMYILDFIFRVTENMRNSEACNE